ncbi:hypothetical protein WOLCODRAFT_22254 [Wolfiporia cocos MD-104 SS10]|uniref:RlpA-like protein double-psi beta-barrel domain-containing protein n=1 Tax=Wolfiporia cocos (strain MD-104) TaxID=742152 RepID=A0A2H3J820_WOLCO|nr:hypothetical protein WOLCODRAFT_22254 [Wolfiporia cocos MD-104 SS10]
MFVPKAVVALAVALYASALSVPHSARNAAHHRSIAVRHAEPEAAPVPAAQPESVIVKPKRKRSLNKRCLPRSSSAALSATSAASSAVPSSSAVVSSVLSSVAPSSSEVATSSAAPINIGGLPPIFSSSSVETPSSTYVAPTTSETPTYTPTSTYTPTTSYAATTASSADISEPTWMYETNSGDATYYAAGLGACGITNTDSDYIVAVSWELFDNYPGYDGTNPNTNPVCNKQITANYEGKSVTVTVTDRCTGCDTTSLDFTPTAFQQMADLSIGRLYGMTWQFT